MSTARISYSVLVPIINLLVEWDQQITREILMVGSMSIAGLGYDKHVNGVRQICQWGTTNMSIDRDLCIRNETCKRDLQLQTRAASP